MSDHRSDPLSLALSCVRRLSDEGLKTLRDAVGAERRDRDEADEAGAFARARWFTATRGRNGYREHIIVTGYYGALRTAREASPGVFGVVSRTLCGLDVRGGAPDRDPDCPRCLSRWDPRVAP